MIRLECSHDVFHALGDARGKWDGRARRVHTLPAGGKDLKVVRLSIPKSVRVFVNKYVTWTTKPTGCTWRTK